MIKSGKILIDLNMKVLSKIYNSFFVNTFQKIQNEHLAFVNNNSNKAFDKKSLFLIIIVCLCLTMIEYFGKQPGYRLSISVLNFLHLDSLSLNLKEILEQNPNRQLYALAYWVGVILLFYFILPILLIKFVFKQKLGDYALQFGKFYKDYKIYLVMLVIMLPLLFIFSGTEGFLSRYPFYIMSKGENLWPNFWIWQMLYFLQFVALEFFFRGFVLHGLKKRFGIYAIFIMMIPYCMIHFDKAFMETIAAIIAGFVLGVLSLKSNSIILGILIHYSIAITMDLAALWQKGILFY